MKTARKAPARTRRTAEDARTAILDAAERRLVASGPKGIRLQDVAADVGISHPTVLHHFGSRERLVDEVLKRRVQVMIREVMLALAGGSDDLDSARALFERLYAALGPGGHARFAAFLALEGRVPGAEPHSLRPLAELTHAQRLSRCIAGGPVPTFDDSYFIVLLAAFALFGEAIVGPLFRGEPEEAPDEQISKRFRSWLAELVLDHMKPRNAPP
ncbi:MAG: Transcriptional regulator, TetR family protein [Myxococcaceae bacterium]|nr:Transcriptional regulator, TetR family protein [Myxococcaceae bacterium]